MNILSAEVFENLHVKIKSLEQLQKENPNLWSDSEGDYWESEDEYENWVHGEESDCIPAYKSTLDTMVPYERFYFRTGDYDKIKWCIEFIVTRESHPEYYL